MLPDFRRSLVIALAVCLAGGGIPSQLCGAPPAKPGLGGLHFFSRKKTSLPPDGSSTTTRKAAPGSDAIRQTPPPGRPATASTNPLRNALDRVTGKARPQVGHALPSAPAPVELRGPALLPEGEQTAARPTDTADPDAGPGELVGDGNAVVIDIPAPPGSDDDVIASDRETAPDRRATSSPQIPHSHAVSESDETDLLAEESAGPKPLETKPQDVEQPTPSESMGEEEEEEEAEPVYAEPAELGEGALPPRRIPTRTASVPQPQSRDPVFTVPTTPRLGEGAAVDHQPAGLTVDWQLEEDLSVGATGRATLTIRNSSAFEATDVVVRAVLAESLEFRQANLPPRRQGQVLLWTLPRVAPQSALSIDLTVRALTAGEAACLASVTSTQTTTRSRQILQPVVEATLAVPAAVIAGDSLTALLEVSNSGAGAARQVVAEVELTEGLMHAKGRQFRLALGSLRAGESRSLRLPLSVVATGPQQMQVLTSARGAPARTATAAVQVLGARLQFDLVGPSRRLVDRPANYALRLRNTSQAPVGGVTLQMQVAHGFDFESASEGGEWDPENRSVAWQIADLGGGAATEVTARLVARQPGLVTHTAEWTSEFGAGETLEVQTQVETAPRLELDISEDADPVEVGSETTWRVVVRNDGSAPAQSVRLLLELPTGVRLVEATGPTRWGADQALVAFAQVPQLKPGARAVYTVTVVGEKPGALRLKAQVTATDLEPLEDEETTRFYSDR